MTKSKENESGEHRRFVVRALEEEEERVVKYVFSSLFPHLNTSEIDLKGFLRER